MDTREITNAIFSGKLDSDLSFIQSAIANRNRSLDSNKLFSLRVGDTVKYNNKTYPKYMVNATGKVREVRRTRVVVDLDFPRRRFNRGVITYTDCIDKI